jgi:hypothetical protein
VSDPGQVAYEAYAAHTKPRRREGVSDPGQIAYEAYAAHTKWKSLKTEDDLPRWNDLPQEIQTAWRVSADAVCKSWMNAEI